MSIDHVPAATLDDAALAELFNRGYSGYVAPVSLNAEQLAAMIALQDLARDDSTVIRVDGAPAAFAFLGVRGRLGWIGGMGVAPEFRGRSLGRVAMEAVLERARARGLDAVDLEVLIENEHAHRIYVALGFVERRLLDVWSRPPADPPPAGQDAAENTVETLDPVAWTAAARGLAAPPLPWQRGEPVLDRVRESLRGFLARDAHGPTAGVMIRPDPARTSLFRLVTRPDAGDQARRAALAAALAAAPPGSPAFALNIEAGDPFAPVLAGLGFTVLHRQREMTLPLRA